MPDRNFSTLVDRIQPHVPQCPYPTIVGHVRDAAIKVCERTVAWRYEIPLFDLLPGVHEYSFNVPNGSEVHTVFAALLNNQPLRPLNLDDALTAFPAWATLYSGADFSTLWENTPSGSANANYVDENEVNGSSEYVVPDAIVADASTPTVITMLTPQRYIVLPLPDNDRTYEMRMFVALKPARDATAMDSQAFNELEDCIMEKAIEELMLLPNMPWTNVEMAGVHANKYIFYSSEKRARANLGHVRGSLTVRQRNWV